MYRDDLTDAFLEQAFSKAVSARLKRLPADCSHVFSKRFERRIKAVLRQSYRPPQVNRVIFLGRRTAAVLVAAIVLAFGAVMGVSAWREAFFEFVQVKLPDRSRVHFEQTADTVLPEKLVKYAPTAIPDGFELVEMDDTMDSTYTLYYENAHGQNIYYDQTRLDKVAYTFDTETHDFEDIELNEQPAKIIDNEMETMLVWESGYYFFVVISNLDKNEVIKIAESVRIVE